MATGGSTNGVLHWLAIAHAAGVRWTLDDFERVRRKVPVLCDLKPSGRYVAVDLHKAGGIPQVMKMLLAHGVLHGECMTITGKTVAENLKDVPDEPRKDQDVIRPWSNPMYAQGHLAILQGQPRARRMRGEDHGPEESRRSRAARASSIPSPRRWTRSSPTGSSRATCVVIRYEGPKGGPGMREMLAPTLGAHRQGARRIRGPHHRRALLRRHVGHGRGPRHARGVRGRPHRAREGRRFASPSTRRSD